MNNVIPNVEIVGTNSIPPFSLVSATSSDAGSSSKK